MGMALYLWMRHPHLKDELHIAVAIHWGAVVHQEEAQHARARIQPF